MIKYFCFFLAKCIIFLTIFIVIVPAHAVNPDEILNDAQLEQRARAISMQLRCMVCQNQSIDESDAPLARDLRLLVRERLVEGDSDDEVIDFVVARYGEFVLLKPRFGSHTILLWLLPVMLLCFAGLFLWQRSGRAAVEGAAVAPSARLSAEEEARLAKLLSESDDPASND